MSNPNGVIDIFNPNGTVSQYRSVSSRLPEFLEAFPLSDGYQVVKEQQTVIAMNGMSSLYEATLKSGHKPEDVGLPPIQSGNNVVFTAKLINADGKVLATASACRSISQYKDWEIGETASLQRLMAVCGHGGELFDDDESQDMSDQGLKTAPATASKPVKLVQSAPVAAQAPPVAVAQQTEPKQAEPVSEAVDEEPKSKDPETPSLAEVGEIIPPALIRQIQHQAKLKRTAVNDFTTVAEAKAELKRLIQLK